MLEAAKIIGMIWVAMILTYGVITIALSAFQWAYRATMQALFQTRPLRKLN
jgi:hypothetical protein